VIATLVRIGLALISPDSAVFAPYYSAILVAALVDGIARQNVLVAVQAIVGQALRNQDDLLETISARLAALGATNDLLVASEWQSAPLREMHLFGRDCSFLVFCTAGVECCFVQSRAGG
jgi:hypothetical protein